MLVRNTQKLHPEFDLALAQRIFVKAGAHTALAGEQITSPHDLFSVETLRDTHGIRTGKAFPTDVFVFGKGEPPRRDGTKIGGIPYWPANRPWPTNGKGAPYLFLAQFNFSDSHDLVSDLPGDILLLLVEDMDNFPYEPDGIRFEWLSLGLQAASQFREPVIAVEEGSFYGVIYRSADYPFDSVGGINPFYRPVADWTDELNISQCYNLPVLNGTKIGGFPHFIQSDDDFPGEFLCQLGSIQAAPEVPYPWVNQAEPLTLDFDDRGIYGTGNDAVFGDMGTIYIFRQGDGSITSSFECY